MARQRCGAALALILSCLVSKSFGFLGKDKQYAESLAAASQLASTQPLPIIPQQLLDGLSLPITTIANKINPLLPSKAASPPSTTTNGITVTLNVTQVTNGDYVGVTVSGVAKPSTYDALAIYLVGGSGLDRLLKYQWSNQDPNYLATGKTSFSFRVINQRAPLVFNYFLNATVANGFFSPATLAASAGPLPFDNYNAPQHVHLALTQNQGEVLVQWTTRDGGNPTVFYGEISGALLKFAVGSNTTYSITDMCGPPANTTAGYIDPGALNYVKLSGLKPSTTYYYKVGDPAIGMSKEFSFLTAPELGPSGTVNILVTADYGHVEIDGSTEYEYTQSLTTDAVTIPNDEDLAATNTLDQLEALIMNVLTDDNAQQGSAPYTTRALVANATGRSLFILDGDVSYARGEQAAWDVFMENMEAIGSIVPWMLTEGNHERDVPFTGDNYANTADDSGGECSVSYQRRTQSLGNPKWAPGNPAWYSINQGPVHYTFFSTEIDYSPGSAQYKFLQADLAAVDRSVTPWIVLNGHRPIYTTSVSPTVVSVAEQQRASFESLLVQYQVDIAFSGHDHIYERTCPIYNGTCQSNLADGSLGGPVYVVLGNAGFTLSYLPNPYLPPYWESVVLEHGYAPCTITATKFSCEMISTITGAVLDSFTLTKPAGWKPDLAGRTSFLANFKQSYFPGGPYPGSGTYLETTGIPGQGLLIIFSAVETALQNPALIAAFAAAKADLKLSSDGPDTVVELAGATAPLLPLFQQLATAPCNGTLACAAQFYSATAYLPILQHLAAAGAAWPTKHGILYP